MDCGLRFERFIGSVGRGEGDCIRGKGRQPQSPFAGIPDETPWPSSGRDRGSRRCFNLERCLAQIPADRQRFADALQFAAVSVQLLGELGVRASVRSRLEFLDRAVRAQAALLGGQAE